MSSYRYIGLLGLWMIASFAIGQDYRSFDGSGNNLAHPSWGTTDEALTTITPLSFGDGYASPGGLSRGNARLISNAIFSQRSSITEPKKHSDFIWLFGQFLDHDITLVAVDANDPLPIQVPICDPAFDPACQGGAIIRFNRSHRIAGTGTDINNPARYENAITAYIDGSNIYGSDETHAAWLRTFQDGLMKTSQGDLLPYNTIDGDINSPVDPTAPVMDIAVPGLTKWFVAGDVRANENTFLAGMHTLFVREHNRHARELKLAHPSWSDEMLYQEARLHTTAILQSIVYDEWLPALGINIPAYRGYRPDVHASIMKVFSGAAFRIGHTMLSSSIPRLDGQCQAHPDGPLRLRDAFFRTDFLSTSEDMDYILRGLASHTMQEVDGQIVDDVRNLLFGSPTGGVGMDLASINIMRGRDMGLPTINEVRTALGLPRFANFFELCNDQAVVDRLSSVYASIDDMDPWVGLLCESHMSDDVMIGQTLSEIFRRQFAALRDGDRYYYEIDPNLTEEAIAEIKSTTMSDIIKRNTGIRLLQDKVFLADEDCTMDNVVFEERLLDATFYPNPTDALGTTRIGIYATQDIDLELHVFDMIGRVVYTDEMPLYTGANFYEFAPAYLESGQYIVQLTAGGAVKRIPFMHL